MLKVSLTAFMCSLLVPFTHCQASEPINAKSKEASALTKIPTGAVVVDGKKNKRTLPECPHLSLEELMAARQAGVYTEIYPDKGREWRFEGLEKINWSKTFSDVTRAGYGNFSGNRFGPLDLKGTIKCNAYKLCLEDAKSECNEFYAFDLILIKNGEKSGPLTTPTTQNKPSAPTLTLGTPTIKKPLTSKPTPKPPAKTTNQPQKGEKELSSIPKTKGGPIRFGLLIEEGFENKKQYVVKVEGKGQGSLPIGTYTKGQRIDFDPLFLVAGLTYKDELQASLVAGEEVIPCGGISPINQEGTLVASARLLINQKGNSLSCEVLVRAESSATAPTTTTTTTATPPARNPGGRAMAVGVLAQNAFDNKETYTFYFDGKVAGRLTPGAYKEGEKVDFAPLNLIREYPLESPAALSLEYQTGKFIECGEAATANSKGKQVVSLRYAVSVSAGKVSCEPLVRLNE